MSALRFARSFVVLLSAVVFLFCSVAARAADPVKLNLVVQAKHDCVNTPVCVKIELPAGTKSGEKAAVVVGPKGDTLQAQVTALGIVNEAAASGSGDKRAQWELHFILPALKAGETAACSATISDGRPSGNVFTWQDIAGQHTTLTYGARPVAQYMYKALDESSPDARLLTMKVFHHLYDPAGTRLVTNSGDGGLYPHHRGLFFGFNKVTYGDGKTCDVWHGHQDAFQSHEGFLASEAGPVLARHRVVVDWHGQKKEVFAKEERELTFYALPGGTLVDFASRVRTTGGLVKLDGDPQHAGFHFRAHRQIADKETNTQAQTYYLRPDGPGKPGETRNWDPRTKQGPVNLPWDAMSFVLGDRRFTVAYLDRPTNPKEARFSERDYGRFGSYFEYDLTEGKPLVVNYRVWLQDGELALANVTKLYQDFNEPVDVTVKTLP